MFILDNLLRNEYFPSELPPCFSSDELANNSSDVLKWVNSFGKESSIPLTYSGYKSETSRRRFAIPNAYHYCKAANVIFANSKNIFRILESSPFSLSAPLEGKPNKNECYRKRSNSVIDTRTEIEKLYQCNRYEIRLDINSFFNNIYTHSIPWAIHGKANAKKDNSDDLWGNVLDTVMRNMNYKQTNGILVGNAISRIISEIILCSIDCEIKKHFKRILYRRFVDDYYIYTCNSTEIQSIISFIRQRLGEFELNLNENKIYINESPFIYGKPWVEQIKQFIHLQPAIFLDKIIIEYNKYKDISIFRYGLKVISLYKYSASDWKIIQSKIINIWTRFPSLSDIILMIFLNNKEMIQKQRMVKALYLIIDYTVSLNYEQEMIWAVWFFKVFDLNISQLYIKQILESKNSLAIIILLDILKSKELNKNEKIKKMLNNLFLQLQAKDYDENRNANNLLWTEYWLLAYEATLNKWLNNGKQVFDYARKNQFYKELLAKKIRLYNPEFTYDESVTKTSLSGYVTKAEMYDTLKKLKASLTNNLKNNIDQTKHELTDEENDMFDKLSQEIIGGEYI